MKKYLGQKIIHVRTRQVYNEPGYSSLSQPKVKKFWSKMIFEQKKIKKCINHA